MTTYYEKNIWHGDGVDNGCPMHIAKGFEQEYEASDVEKRLHRAVYAQIRELLGKNPPNLFISRDGILNFESLDGLSEEDKNTIYDILNTYRFGVYSRHQFKDYESDGKGQKKKYDMWFTGARESFLYTMPLKQLLKLSDYDRDGWYTGELKDVMTFHNHTDELSRNNIGLKDGYSIQDIKYILEFYLDPFTILGLIGDDVHIEEIKGVKYPVCTFKNGSKKVKLAVSFSSKEIFFVQRNGLKYLDNSYEFLFKYLRLPISKVLSSVLSVKNYYMLPGEGMGNYHVDEALGDKIDSITNMTDYDYALRLTDTSSFWRR